jgi:hypothetical protein
MFATLFVLFNAVVMTVDGYQVHRSPHILPDTAVFDDTIKCMPATTYYVLTLMAIVPLSAFISVFVTSQLYKKNLLAIIAAAFSKQPVVVEEEEEEESDQEEEPEETPEEKYSKLYPIKRATHDPPKCLDELKYTIMVETTPRGTLLMCYNNESEGFEYWSDTDIPLTMLETAARRYVTEYNCKKFYLPRKKTNVVDKEDEASPSVEIEPESAPSVEIENADEEDDVFIKRKKTDAQLKLEKQIAEEEPVTRFLRKGKLVDFKPKELFKGMNFDEQVVKKTLDYETFKKAMGEVMTESINSTPSRQDYASIRDACDSGRF